MMKVIGRCRILVRKNGKIVDKFNALDPTGSVNALATFLAYTAHPASLLAPDTLSLEDSSQAPLATTFTTPPTADIPLDGTGLSEGALTVSSSTTIAYTSDPAVPASVVFEIGIPAGYFPATTQHMAAVSVNHGGTTTAFSRVTFSSALDIDDATALTLEYTYTLVPAGV